MIGGTPEDWGIIPSFLDTEDPRTAREQFDAHYQGGWQPFDGFSFDKDTGVLSYLGDPPMRPLSAMIFREETIAIFPSAWVLVLQPDDSWEVCRMD
jgi:hypothetical protein